MCRGQDVGDGIWPVLAALLSRAAQLQVRRGPRLAAMHWRRRLAAACMPQCSGSHV
jgi:hypothetical protein